MRLCVGQEHLLFVFFQINDRCTQLVTFFIHRHMISEMYFTNEMKTVAKRLFP